MDIAFDANAGRLWVLGLVDLDAGEPGAAINSAAFVVHIEDEDGSQVWPSSGTASMTALGAGVAAVVHGTTYADGNYKLDTPANVAWAKRSDSSFERHVAVIVESTLGIRFEHDLFPRTRT